MSTCMWCGEPTVDEPEQHILPEGLIGDQPVTQHASGKEFLSSRRLVLDEDQVCARCNGATAQLDDHLQKTLGVFKVFWNRLGTKRGKPAKVERPGLYAVRDPGTGPQLILNAEKHAISREGGIVVHPSKKRHDAVRVTNFSVEAGGIGRITFQQGIRLDKKFIRALHKVALELLCFQEGLLYALAPRFDSVREYVLRGRGRRAVLMWRKAELEAMHSVALQTERIDAEWFVKIRLGAWFYVDLTPENIATRIPQEELEREDLAVVWDDQAGSPK